MRCNRTTMPQKCPSLILLFLGGLGFLQVVLDCSLVVYLDKSDGSVAKNLSHLSKSEPDDIMCDPTLLLRALNIVLCERSVDWC